MKPAQEHGGKRSLARLGAVQAHYEMVLSGAQVDRVMADFLARRLGQELDGDQYREADPDWFRDLVKGTLERSAEIDERIKLVAERDVARLDVLLRAILRTACYEFLARIDTPAAIIVSEYVDVTRSFYDASEVKLVNGILDRMGRDIRPGELKDAPPAAPKKSKRS